MLWLRSLLPRLFLIVMLIPSWINDRLFEHLAFCLRSNDSYLKLKWLLATAFDTVTFAVNIWTVRQICGPTCATMPFFRFTIQCWLKSVIGSIISFVAFVPAYNLLFDSTSVEEALTLLWFAGMMHFFLPPCSVASLIVLLLLAIVLLAEVVVDEVIAWKHSRDPIPEISPTSTCGYWRVVAVLRSENNGYCASQFYPVKVCDTNLLDDPFWPDHVSTVCMVEIRRRNSIWKTITIWRVSLLSGGKKKLRVFNRFDNRTDGNVFARSVTFNGIAPRCAVRCFQSAGVIMVFLLERQNSVLFVYDIRYGKSGSYELKFTSLSMISIKCFGRIFSVDRSVAGWRIQFVDEHWTDCSCHFHHDQRYRPTLRKQIIELRQEARVIDCEEITFGQCYDTVILQQLFKPQFVRTSNGLIGVHEYNILTGDGPTLLYDQAWRSFRYFPTFQSLLRSDQQFTAYLYTPSPFGQVRSEGEVYGEMCPAILNRNECVECFPNGIIYRTEFRAPNLKYHAIKALFVARPGLRSEMSAEEFQRQTGLRGMESHFDR